MIEYLDRIAATGAAWATWAQLVGTVALFLGACIRALSDTRRPHTPTQTVARDRVHAL